MTLDFENLVWFFAGIAVLDWLKWMVRLAFKIDLAIINWRIRRRQR